MGRARLQSGRPGASEDFGLQPLRQKTGARSTTLAAAFSARHQPSYRSAGADPLPQGICAAPFVLHSPATGFLLHSLIF